MEMVQYFGVIVLWYMDTTFKSTSFAFLYSLTDQTQTVFFFLKQLNTVIKSNDDPGDYWVGDYRVSEMLGIC